MATINGLGGLSVRCGEIADEVEENAKKKVRITALAIDRFLVQATPVDTGRARANWILTLDTPTDDVIDVPDEGVGTLTNPVTQAAEAISDRTYGQPVFISNNVPYIGVLNDGHSKQAPAGFVENAVNVGTRAAEKILLVNK